MNAITQEGGVGPGSGEAQRNPVRRRRPPAGRKGTFILPAPKGRWCESAFALLSHKKVTKRLWPAASYGKIGIVGYGLFAGKGRVIL